MANAEAVRDTLSYPLRSDSSMVSDYDFPSSTEHESLMWNSYSDIDEGDEDATSVNSPPVVPQKFTLMLHITKSNVRMTAIGEDGNMEPLQTRMGRYSTPFSTALIKKNFFVFGPELLGYVGRAKNDADFRRRDFVHWDLGEILGQEVWDEGSIVVNKKIFSFPNHVLVALFFNYLKTLAERNLSTTSPSIINQVVFCVPMWYGSLQRTRLKDSAEIAGFEKVFIVNEGSAAAYLHLASKQQSTGASRNLMVLTENSRNLELALYRSTPEIFLEMLACSGNLYASPEIPECHVAQIQSKKIFDRFKRSKVDKEGKYLEASIHAVFGKDKIMDEINVSKIEKPEYFNGSESDQPNNLSEVDKTGKASAVDVDRQKKVRKSLLQTLHAELREKFPNGIMTDAALEILIVCEDESWKLILEEELDLPVIRYDHFGGPPIDDDSSISSVDWIRPKFAIEDFYDNTVIDLLPFPIKRSNSLSGHCCVNLVEPFAKAYDETVIKTFAVYPTTITKIYQQNVFGRRIPSGELSIGRILYFKFVKFEIQLIVEREGIIRLDSVWACNDDGERVGKLSCPEEYSWKPVNLSTKELENAAEEMQEIIEFGNSYVDGIKSAKENLWALLDKMATDIWRKEYKKKPSSRTKLKLRIEEMLELLRSVDKQHFVDSDLDGLVAEGKKYFSKYFHSIEKK